MKRIAKTTYVEDIVFECPEAHEFLLDKNLKCTHCGEAVWGTLGKFLSGCGIADIDGFIRELNEFVKKKRTGGAKRSGKSKSQRSSC